MTAPTLRLAIVDGPRRGEVLDCAPSAAPIRIGRVARGNTFAFKDPGVSQKHLLLDLLPSSASGWALTDLGSSNGSLLNGTAVAPSCPAPISDGDCIKIGESTSISVSTVGDPEAASGPRRTRASSRRMGPNKDVALQPEAADLKKGRGRRARVPAKDEVLESIDEDGVMISEKGEDGAENSKKDGTLEPVEEDRNGVLEPSVEKTAEEKRNLGRGRRGRGRGRERTRASSARVSKEEGASEAPEIASRGDMGKSDGGKADALVGSGEGRKVVEIEEDAFDMERMTLGEWFDRMEKYLPQVINDVSEEIIMSLMAKAQMLNKFVDDGLNVATDEFCDGD